LKMVEGQAYPCLRWFSGHCARTCALALCPLGLAEGRELLQNCRGRVLRCRNESWRLDCVVVVGEVVEIDFAILVRILEFCLEEIEKEQGSSAATTLALISFRQSGSQGVFSPSHKNEDSRPSLLIDAAL
jgi:hypothetical protein